MKRTRTTRYVGLEAKTAGELGELLTKKCEELRQFSPEIVWNLQNGNSAFLIYEETTEEPENLRELYEMQGKGCTCADCPFKEPNTDGRNRYPYKCLHKRPGTLPDDAACNWFYIQMEEGKVL